MAYNGSPSSLWKYASVKRFYFGAAARQSLSAFLAAASSEPNQKIRRLSVRFLYSQMPVAAAPPARAPMTAPFFPLTIPPVAAPAPAPMPMTVAAPAGPSIHLCL